MVLTQPGIAVGLPWSPHSGTSPTPLLPCSLLQSPDTEPTTVYASVMMPTA